MLLVQLTTIEIRLSGQKPFNTSSMSQEIIKVEAKFTEGSGIERIK